MVDWPLRSYGIKQQRKTFPIQYGRLTSSHAISWMKVEKVEALGLYRVRSILFLLVTRPLKFLLGVPCNTYTSRTSVL